MSKDDKQREAETKAEYALLRARTNLVLDQPFFGVLALRLQPTVDWTAGTAWTDGNRIGYHPDFINKLSIPEVQGVLCHEVLHVADGHPWRRDAREMVPWNVACDLAINPIITEAGMTLPKDALLDPACAGKCAEEIFTHVKVTKVKMQAAGFGDGKGGPGDGEGCGGVRDAPGNASEKADQESEWKCAVTQAASAARAQGKLPAGLDKYINELLRPKVDWRTVLRRFLQAASKNDYTWRMPSPRYMASGLYLPMLKTEDMGPIVFAIDTSGSVMNELQQFCSEVNSAVEECKPEQVMVIYCDADVGRVDTFERGELITFHSVGGGGTSFIPPFDHVAQDGIQPVCLVYLTDLYGDFPEVPPDFPVLWVTVTEVIAPWGETVRMEAGHGG